jgi:hypothetical protein
MVNNNLALGVTVYGNGGMNTDYPEHRGTDFGGMPKSCWAAPAAWVLI